MFPLPEPLRCRIYPWSWRVLGKMIKWLYHGSMGGCKSTFVPHLSPSSTFLSGSSSSGGSLEALMGIEGLLRGILFLFLSSCCHLCLPLRLGSPHLTSWHQSLVSSLLLALRMTRHSGGGARVTDTCGWRGECLNPSWRQAPVEVEKLQ